MHYDSALKHFIHYVRHVVAQKSLLIRIHSRFSRNCRMDVAHATGSKPQVVITLFQFHKGISILGTRGSYVTLSRVI